MEIAALHGRIQNAWLRQEVSRCDLCSGGGLVPYDIIGNTETLSHAAFLCLDSLLYSGEHE